MAATEVKVPQVVVKVDQVVVVVKVDQVAVKVEEVKVVEAVHMKSMHPAAHYILLNLCKTSHSKRSHN